MTRTLQLIVAECLLMLLSTGVGAATWKCRITAQEMHYSHRPSEPEFNYGAGVLAAAFEQINSYYRASSAARLNNVTAIANACIQSDLRTLSKALFEICAKASENEFALLVSGIELNSPTSYHYISDIYKTEKAPHPIYLKYGSKFATTHGETQFNLAECLKFPSGVAYLNGISTTYHGAKEALKAIQRELGDAYNDAPLIYQLLHNQTFCGSGLSTSCLADLAETFEQRQDFLNQSLKNRWELFWEILGGRHQNSNSMATQLINTAGAIRNSVSDLIVALDFALRNKLLELTTASFRQPLREQDLIDHINILNANAKKDISTTIIAHSQGNLFANSLGERYPTILRQTKPPIHFVNVAPPITKFGGKYILADIDLVIGGLGSLIPGTTPAANITIPFSASDKTGHGFLETYWDHNRPAFRVVRKLVTDTLDAH